MKLRTLRNLVVGGAVGTATLFPASALAFDYEAVLCWDDGSQCVYPQAFPAVEKHERIDENLEARSVFLTFALNSFKDPKGQEHQLTPTFRPSVLLSETLGNIGLNTGARVNEPFLGFPWRVLALASSSSDGFAEVEARGTPSDLGNVLHIGSLPQAPGPLADAVVMIRVVDPISGASGPFIRLSMPPTSSIPFTSPPPVATISKTVLDRAAREGRTSVQVYGCESNVWSLIGRTPTEQPFVITSDELNLVVAAPPSCARVGPGSSLVKKSLSFAVEDSANLDLYHGTPNPVGGNGVKVAVIDSEEFAGLVDLQGIPTVANVTDLVCAAEGVGGISHAECIDRFRFATGSHGTNSVLGVVESAPDSELAAVMLDDEIDCVRAFGRLNDEGHPFLGTAPDIVYTGISCFDRSFYEGKTADYNVLTRFVTWAIDDAGVEVITAAGNDAPGHQTGEVRMGNELVTPQNPSPKQRVILSPGQPQTTFPTNPFWSTADNSLGEVVWDTRTAVSARCDGWCTVRFNWDQWPNPGGGWLANTITADFDIEIHEYEFCPSDPTDPEAEPWYSYMRPVPCPEWDERGTEQPVAICEFWPANDEPGDNCWINFLIRVVLKDGSVPAETQFQLHLRPEEGDAYIFRDMFVADGIDSQSQTPNMALVQPASHDDILNVGASYALSYTGGANYPHADAIFHTSSDQIRPFFDETSRGPNSAGVDTDWITAPGVWEPPSGPVFTGTSSAGPLVAGAAALAMENSGPLAARSEVLDPAFMLTPLTAAGGSVSTDAIGSGFLAVRAQDGTGEEQPDNGDNNECFAWPFSGSLLLGFWAFGMGRRKEDEISS